MSKLSNKELSALQETLQADQEIALALGKLVAGYETQKAFLLAKKSANDTTYQGMIKGFAERYGSDARVNPETGEITKGEKKELIK